MLFRSEAFLAQEASRTGHPVLTTIHSNSCEATYRRMATLCKRKYDITDDVLFELVTEAFPLVAFSKQLENRERKANYKFIGIDLEKEYCNIASARIDYALNKFEYDILIEYDGEQHFSLARFGNKTIEQAKKELDKYILHDNIKNNWCLKNNKKLLRYSYKDFNKLEELLGGELWHKE